MSVQIKITVTFILVIIRPKGSGGMVNDCPAFECPDLVQGHLGFAYDFTDPSSKQPICVTTSCSCFAELFTIHSLRNVYVAV